jgi:coronin-1B/1C/6
VWKIQDSLFEGWGEDGWEAEDLSPVAKLNAGGRCVFPLSWHCRLDTV